MKEPKIPENEEERLKKLRYYKVLDTLPEKEFDDLVNLASHICNTPIALVSLVDSDRQWFKAKVGIDAEETPRSISFCGHAINDKKVFEVSNAMEDERFCDNPLVVGDPNIRFYAGAPLITPDHYKIGTLCVIDSKSQKLNAKQIEQLEALSRIVVQQLEIRMHNQRLEEALAVKDRIMSTVAHELKNPLNGIMGITQILSDSNEHPEIQREMRVIQECGDHLLEIINDILEINRINSEKVILNPKPLNLRSEIQNILKLIDTSFSHKKLQIEFDFSKDLPETILGDGLRIKQVLYNIIGNAFKFTKDGTILVKTEYVNNKNSRDPDKVIISVKDSGIGIDEKEFDNIFKEFVQESKEVTQNYGGSGLGLSIGKKLANLMGGDIEVKSKKGEGSTFKFSFNILNTSTSPVENIFNKADQYNILIVDDNNINLKVITKLLNRLGFSKVQSTDNGKDAVILCKNTHFDLIFMDIYMPEMDGLEAAKEILENNSKQKIIGLSANDVDFFGKKASEVGMVDYIEKPIQKEVLINSLEKYLKKSPQ